MGLRKHSIDTESSTDDNEDEPASSSAPPSKEQSMTENKQEPIDLSTININPALKKAAEQHLEESMKKLKFSDTIELNKVDENPTVNVKSNIENTNKQSIPNKPDDKAAVLENLQAVTKHNFDKGSRHDDDDDDDGESKVCLKCEEDFITYSGKDHCPQCR